MLELKNNDNTTINNKVKTKSLPKYYHYTIYLLSFTIMVIITNKIIIVEKIDSYNSNLNIRENIKKIAVKYILNKNEEMEHLFYTDFDIVSSTDNDIILNEEEIKNAELNDLALYCNKRIYGYDDKGKLYYDRYFRYNASNDIKTIINIMNIIINNNKKINNSILLQKISDLVSMTCIHYYKFFNKIYSEMNSYDNNSYIYCSLYLIIGAYYKKNKIENILKSQNKCDKYFDNYFIDDFNSTIKYIEELINFNNKNNIYYKLYKVMLFINKYNKYYKNKV